VNDTFPIRSSPSRRKTSSKRPSFNGTLSGEPFVGVFRGDRVESVHAVAACVCDTSGEVKFALGTIDVPVFLRSSWKPVFAAALVESGLIERFGLTPKELAVVAGSHAGEPGHVAAVRSILEKSGVPESALRCGEPGRAILHNCSGKHAGLLAFARMRGESLADYLDPAHPAQAALRSYCERLNRETISPDATAIDGCGFPVYAVTLRTAAAAFARLASGESEPLRVVRDAMRREPWYVAGTDRFDTDVMRETGAIVAKGGAEGVFLAGDTRTGRGFALKVIDGNSRAVAPAAVALFRRVDALYGREFEAVRRYAEPMLRNVSGTVIGSIRAIAD
jgi:L-asparaginase II